MEAVVENTQVNGNQTTQTLPVQEQSNISPVQENTNVVEQNSPNQLSPVVETKVEFDPTDPNAVLPDNYVRLSTGVVVKFKKINKAISNTLTVKTFTNINLDKKGNLVSENMSTNEQLSVARQISEYHSTLINHGVSLIGEIRQYLDRLDLESNWAKQLMRSGLVETEFYDINNDRDLEFLFLRFHGFESDEDFALLSQRTMNQ